MDKNLAALDRLLKALADPTRARIMGLLSGGEICVCHIHETLDITQTKASRHLAYLRRAGLVAAEKRGLWVYYRLAPFRDPIVRMACESIQHCIAHVPAARRDAARLKQKTGNSAGPLQVPSCGCCEPMV